MMLRSSFKRCRGRLTQSGFLWARQVALIYNSSSAADSIAAEIAASNPVTARAYKADVSSQPDIEAVVQQVAADFGRLDIIVVNSGITSTVAAEDYSVQQWREIMKVNLDGAFYTAQAAARIFKVQGSGNVIFTASVSATLVNLPQKQAAVSACGPPFLTTKHGVFFCSIFRAPLLTAGYVVSCVFPACYVTSTVQRLQSRRRPAGKMSCC